MWELGEQDIFYHYCDLWHHIESKGVVVQYSDDPGRYHLKGYFKPAEAWNYELTATSVHRKPGPLIVICSPPRLYYGPARSPGPSRHRVDDQPVDLQDELFTLAHEFGHYRLWKTGAPSTAPLRATIGILWPALTPLPQRLLIVEEERDAWDLGRDFVPPHLQADYDRVAAAAVSEYENTLEVHRV